MVQGVGGRGDSGGAGVTLSQKLFCSHGPGQLMQNHDAVPPSTAGGMTFSIPALGRSQQRTLCSLSPGPWPRHVTVHWSEPGPGPSVCDPVSILWFCFYKHRAAAQVHLPPASWNCGQQLPDLATKRRMPGRI